MGSTTEGTIASTALTLGVVAGLRSQLPLALLGWRIRQQQSSGGAVTLPAAVRSRWFVPVTSMLAIGELAGDKLPVTPSRLNPGPLAGRLLFGAMAGLITVRTSRQSPALGALIGASGAIAGAFGGYYVRKAIGHLSGVPDPIVAIGEDAVAIGIGAWAAQGLPIDAPVKNPAGDS